MDASARVTLKDAAKCDKRRERQNFESQKNAERILHFQIISGSMSTPERYRSKASSELFLLLVRFPKVALFCDSVQDGASR